MRSTSGSESALTMKRSEIQPVMCVIIAFAVAIIAPGFYRQLSSHRPSSMVVLCSTLIPKHFFNSCCCSSTVGRHQAEGRESSRASTVS
jgi:hypothetical protein